PAIAQCLAEGISINVTLIFSLDRYAAVMDAFLDGMERARLAGHDLSRLASVASFFVSRVDTEVDKRLDKLGSGPAQGLRGEAAIANARLAFQRYEDVFATDRWKALAAAGARPQRPLWASTGVKDPSYDDTRYVVELVTSGVVNTMPEATLRAVADHGLVRGDTVRGGYADAAGHLADLAAAGVDYDDVVADLERDGLATFEASWSNLAEALDTKLAAARHDGEGADAA
ncbi:MAG: transaldolase family protein, partial [Actinomycetes bacterium]